MKQKKRIIVNFKAYSEASGSKAQELADSFSEIAEKSESEIIVAPDLIDTIRTTGEGVKVYGQHVDPVRPGSHTGNITAEMLKASGASGTLLNHSEKRMEKEEVRQSLEACKEAGLETVVCAQTVQEVEELSDLGPDFVAFEPPELIGGDTSVSTARPGMIEDAVERTDEGVGTLTGAGIKDCEDVMKSIELGCDGVLVASGVVKSRKPVERLENLCEGL